METIIHKTQERCGCIHYTLRKGNGQKRLVFEADLFCNNPLHKKLGGFKYG